MANWITTKQGNHIDLDLYEAIEDYYRGKETPTLYLERKEYAAVISAINNVYHTKYANRKYCSHLLSNAHFETNDSYAYIFVNNGFNDYRIIDKINIEDNIYQQRKRK